MSDVLFKFAVKLILDYIAKYLTPEKVDEGKALAVAWLRREAAATRTFPFDDQLVELIAHALSVK